MDYSRFISTASRLVTKFGASGKVNGQSCSVVFVNKLQDGLSNQTGAGGTILSTTSTDKDALVAGVLKEEPQVGQLLVTDKVTWTITSVATVAPAGDAIIYRLGVTR